MPYIRVVHADPARERQRRDEIAAGYDRLAAEERDPEQRAHFQRMAARYRLDGFVAWSDVGGIWTIMPYYASR